MARFASLVAGLFSHVAAADTRVVDDDRAECPEAQYLAIQEAVDAADDGDTVQVCAGEYRERVRVAKPLRLSGARAGMDGRQRQFDDAAESVVRSPAPLLLLTDDITVDGFTLRVELDEDLEGQGIFTYGSGYTIVNNLIEDDRVAGIALTTIGEKRVTIAQNQFRGRLAIAADGEGAARNAVIRDNLFRNASIRVVDGASRDVTVADNVFVFEPDAATACVDDRQIECRPSIYVALTRNVTLTGNSMAGTGAYAVRVRGNAGLRMLGNRFSAGAADGVQLAGHVADAQVAGNDIAGQAGAALRLDGASGYLVEQNRIDDSGVGLDASEASADNDLRRNEVRRSRELDCRDRSVGDASFGTANRWEENLGLTSLPAGLCAGAAP